MRVNGSRQEVGHIPRSICTNPSGCQNLLGERQKFVSNIEILIFSRFENMVQLQGALNQVGTEPSDDQTKLTW